MTKMGLGDRQKPERDVSSSYETFVCQQFGLSSPLTNTASRETRFLFQEKPGNPRDLTDLRTRPVRKALAEDSQAERQETAALGMTQNRSVAEPS